MVVEAPPVEVVVAVAPVVEVVVAVVVAVVMVVASVEADAPSLTDAYLLVSSAPGAGPHTQARRRLALGFLPPPPHNIT